MLKAAVDEAYKNGYFRVVILRGTIHRVQSIASQNQQITTGLILQLFWFTVILEPKKENSSESETGPVQNRVK